jgi:hypothetical protein
MTLRAAILPLFVLALAATAAVPLADAAQGRAFVFATDFASGNLASVGFGPPPAATCNVAPTCSDAVLRYHQGRLYVVERFGCDNIRVLDPNAAFAVVQQFSVGNGSNPNDIVIVSPTRAYVTRYDTADLWIVNPQTGAFLGSVSLAAFADADGIPEMNRLAVRNGRVFVTVQRVDRDSFFSPTDSSQVVVVDAATGALVDCDPVADGVQGILLPFQNPTTELVTDPAGKLVVGCTGFYGAQDGGIVRIDPVGLTVEASEVTEATLGGDIVDLAIASATRGFAIIADGSFNTVCRPWARGAGTAGAPVFATAGFFLSDAEVNDRSELWLADRTPANPGIRVYDALTLTPLVTGPVSTCLPPQDIEFDGDATVDVASAGPAGAAVRYAGAWPNPSRGAVTVRLALGSAFAGGSLRLTLLDAAGRRVRRLEHEVPPAAAGGNLALSWDGRDDAGRPVAPGVYGVRVEGAGAVATGRLVRLPAARL